MSTATTVPEHDVDQDVEQPVASLRDLAMEAAALDVLAARVAAAKKDVRARLQAALDDAARRDGVERVAAELPDGRAVATVSLRKGSVGPVVVDEDTFARWVAARWPEQRQEFTETRVVRTVKAWRAAELVGEMAALDLSIEPGKSTRPAMWADPDTGELVEVPGVLIKPVSARTHSLTWRKDGKAMTAEAWRTGGRARQFAALTTGTEK
ncbi:hypothetical protein SEA_PICARD_38 [Streptomyces phage Picard]|uniref:Uncharacterized protein n=1 Tax=Streptomyces phage Picard TaxID=1920311 RepID=A0A1J0MC42_9CAUD|nr:hypothetical protein HOR45_gp38 [Streptomyces phage Picard]APD18568.1 hypothetical protein SEA_PICARD_38 [Streptomyces phage Picard]